MESKNTNNIIVIISTFLLALTGTSCSDYLDVVPDNVPTIENAFKSRYEAEGFLYGCYSFLPDHGSPTNNPAFFGGDEAWLFDDASISLTTWGIAKGEQGTNSPIANYYGSRSESGLNTGNALLTAIRDCNIFLENIHKPADLTEDEREVWIAEVKVLKAYYHFWLFRMYGPIPVIKENIPIHASPEDVQIYRKPIDEVVDYIVTLLDEASSSLPLTIEETTLDMGRITRPIALALKGQVLTYAASPLFNGNPDYAGFVDNRGVNLFPQNYDNEKWGKAAEALREAIDVCHEAGHELYDFNSSPTSSLLNEKTVAAMQVRGAATERWNDEIIWGSTRSTYWLQRISIPATSPTHQAGHINQVNAPTLRVVEQFYTENGVPVEEDKDWVDVDLFDLKEGDEKHKYYIEENFETINLHFNREARFYGSVSFDGGTFFGFGNLSNDDPSSLRKTYFKYAAVGGFRRTDHSATGYLVKKVININTAMSLNQNMASIYNYAFPVIRLADLYLMYAEALNEYKENPDAEVYEYIDLVRNRTELDGVVESWAEHSVDPQKPLSKEGMREIIQRERMNELAFEGKRFWDLRRWKLSEDYMNRPIRGLSILEDDNNFYQVQNLYNPTFEMKDYLWPLKQSTLLKNGNLTQNPGW